jgi:GTPase Era involved in 16S rRNA processing
MRGDLLARGFICVERESQKASSWGGGERIRSIVRDAEELSEIFPYAVKLDLRVRWTMNRVEDPC